MNQWPSHSSCFPPPCFSFSVQALPAVIDSTRSNVAVISLVGRTCFFSLWPLKTSRAQEETACCSMLRWITCYANHADHRAKFADCEGLSLLDGSARFIELLSIAPLFSSGVLGLRLVADWLPVCWHSVLWLHLPIGPRRRRCGFG